MSDDNAGVEGMQKYSTNFRMIKREFRGLSGGLSYSGDVEAQLNCEGA